VLVLPLARIRNIRLTREMQRIANPILNKCRKHGSLKPTIGENLAETGMGVWKAVDTYHKIYYKHLIENGATDKLARREIIDAIKREYLPYAKENGLIENPSAEISRLEREYLHEGG